MQTTKTLFGASRLPLTPKRGNKDFYKGTGQSYVPSGGHRTGPPGKHVIRGSAKYRLLDDRVRYFVGPGGQPADTVTDLKPYVLREPSTTSASSSSSSTTSFSKSQQRLPSFSPRPNPVSIELHPTTASSSSSSSSPDSPTGGTTKLVWNHRKSFQTFHKRYHQLDIQEKQALVMHFRRNWWNAMINRTGGGGLGSDGVNGGQADALGGRNAAEEEERRTRELEQRAQRS